MTSRLHELAGLPASRSEGIPVMTRAAVLMLEARVMLCPDWWSQQDEHERSALAAAGRRLDVRQAARTGRAAQGEVEALAVEAEVDGGTHHDLAVVALAVTKTAELLAEARERGGNGDV